jgi:hypothetical protein
MFKANVDYVVADELFCLQSDLEIKNSFEVNKLLNLQFTFNTLRGSCSSFYSSL